MRLVEACHPASRSLTMSWDVQGRYEAAMRDYKKGKLLLETRPNQLLPVGTTKDGQSIESAQQQQKRILDKVWATVEKVMGHMRSDLLAKLQEPSRSVEEQEKTIESVLTVTIRTLVEC